MKVKLVIFVATLVVSILGACNGSNVNNSNTSTRTLRGSSSYTPYDAHAMLWSRGGEGREMVWVGSGGEAGQLLVSTASPNNRPDWIICTQGVVAGLAARGERVVIIGTVYISDQAILPVFRRPRRPLVGARSLFIPRSSIEFAFDRLLQREGVRREDVRVPNVERVAFTNIASLLAKPVGDQDALDFAILVDPFITNLVNENRDAYEVGQGGLYEMHYSIVVRESDLRANRAQFVELLRQFLEADRRLNALTDDNAFYSEVWGRRRDGSPELMPRLITYRREPARLQLQTGILKQRLREELQYLTGKYPEQLRMPDNVDALVDSSLLEEVASDRVTR